MTNHLPDDIIRSYVNGAISQADRESAHQHAVECEDCMHHLTAAALSLKFSRSITKLLFEDDLAA